MQHDYTCKQGLVWQQVFLPKHAPQEWQDQSVLWNAVEGNEKTKKAMPIIQIPRHREISHRIAELTEELEELRSEKSLLLQSLQYAEDTGVDVIRKDVVAMEAARNSSRRYSGERSPNTTNRNGDYSGSAFFVYSR